MQRTTAPSPRFLRCNKGQHFLCQAYQLAVTNMNTWTWRRCCNEACRLLNSLGLNQALFYKTVTIWNHVFRKFECIPHPNPLVQCGKQPLPRLLEIFPDTKEQIVAFGVRNLATLIIEGLQNFIVSSIVPRLASQWQKDQEVAVEDTTSGSVRPTSSTSLTATTTENDEDRPQTVAYNSQKFLIHHFLVPTDLRS